ncbi:DUF732 domain-containing protein [Mycobacterium sp. pR1184]|uniref:DUF732 domain-containing protein n=1 Tax=Mycobacterium sp. pR1184 TaxID=3238981 RepID=UPI00351AD0D4
MNTALSVRAAALGTLAAFALSLGGASPVAHATTTDDFLRTVRTNGVGLHKTNADLIEDAEEVCDMLDYQESAFQYLDQQSGLNDQQAAMFVAASVKYFCPQFTPG